MQLGTTPWGCPCLKCLAATGRHAGFVFAGDRGKRGWPSAWLRSAARVGDITVRHSHPARCHQFSDRAAGDRRGAACRHNGSGRIGDHLRQIYAADSWLVGTGNRGQDVAILLVEVPLLLLALWWYRRGGTVAAVALTGVLSFFTYYYVSMTFATAQNRLFPLYVAAGSMAGFTLVVVARRIDPIRICGRLTRPAGTYSFGNLSVCGGRSFDPGLVTGHGICGDQWRYRSQGWPVHEFGDRRT